MSSCSCGCWVKALLLLPAKWYAIATCEGPRASSDDTSPINNRCDKQASSWREHILHLIIAKRREGKKCERSTLQLTRLFAFSMKPVCIVIVDRCWAEAPIKIARMTLTIKLDGNWSSFQLANSTPPLSVTDSAIAPSARMVDDAASASG